MTDHAPMTGGEHPRRSFLKKGAGAAGAIGQPVLAWATCHTGLSVANTQRSWLLDHARAGGGPLYDIASHRIDLMNFFFGEPLRVAAQLSNVVHALAVEDSATAMVEYKNKLRAVVDVR